MKKQHNHISDKSLSKYFDDKITASEQDQIEAHLKRCSYCRNRLQQFQQLRTIAQKSADPEVNRNLWAAIENQLDLQDKDGSLSFNYKKWGAAAAIVLLILAGGWWIAGPSFSDMNPEDVETTTVNQFAFDYGLYLSGLDNPEIMQRFNEGYKRHKVARGGAVDSSAFQARRSFINRLPREISVVSTYLLESACCQCNQFSLEHDGQQITVFQQPKKHPAEFTGFHKKHAKIDSTDCSKVEAGSHMALAFDSGDSKYVVIGSRQDPMVPRLMDRLSNEQ